MVESKNLGVDPGTAGDWLYKQGELVLGPVPGKQLVEKLFAGEIDGRTEVSPLGQMAFRRIADVGAFKIHLAKAEAKQRVEAAQRAEQERAARRRNFRIALVVTVALVGAALAAVAARYLAIYNPLKKSGELEFADITMDPPTISVARARSDEELLDYPVGGGTPSPTRRPTSERPEHTERPDKGKTAVAERSPGNTGEKPSKSGKQGLSSAADDPEGLQIGQVDQDAINAVVAARRQSLFVCFKEEASRNDKFGGQIPLEFSVGNDGRVTKLWVDRPEYKQGPLYDCLLRELQKWPFKPQPTAASVKLAYTINIKH